jgi:hypothetical protein
LIFNPQWVLEMPVFNNNKHSPKIWRIRVEFDDPMFREVLRRERLLAKSKRLILRPSCWQTIDRRQFAGNIFHESSRKFAGEWLFTGKSCWRTAG